MRMVIRYKGGPGSGNFGHTGRPGKVGGSASGGRKPTGTASKARIAGKTSRKRKKLDKEEKT